MTEPGSSWRELDDAVADTSWCLGRRHVHSTLVFRGLARASYRNVSSLSRLGDGYADLERHLVRNFRKYAHRERPGPPTWDWLALAQHHGLPTRLLDWTFSPLVALHFATASWAGDDAAPLPGGIEGVHDLLPGDLGEGLRAEGSLVFTTEGLAQHARGLPELDALAEDREPFVLFFEPPSLNERIVNQAAVLSVIADPTVHMEDWLDDHQDLWRAWQIPPEVKEEIRERLDQANMNERLLLPGLDGLAAWLRRYYSPSRVNAGATAGGASMSAGAGGTQQEGAMAGSDT